MDSNSYLKWALTKDRSQEQYDQLGNRLNQSTPQLRLLHAAMGISGESGELMDAVKKRILYNKPLDVENVKEELGDLLWYISLMIDQVGSSFEEVMKMNHDKLEKRYPSGFSEKMAQQRLDKMTTIDKLNKLYEMKDKVHPLSMVMIVGFVETQKRVLKAHDITFIEEIYPTYFNDDGTFKCV